MTFYVGQRVKARIDMIDDLRDDGFPLTVCAKRGEILVIREMRPSGNFAVSHPEITDSTFIVSPDEIEVVQ